jgi:uncharacterized membrane protein (DUF4010 family)
MELAELFQRMALALGVGLLVGVERGWRQREEASGQRTAGLRTFALIGLLGGLAGAVAAVLPAGAGGGLVLGLTFATLGAVLGAFQFRESVHDGTFSVTGVISGLVTFALGAYAMLGDPHVAAAGGVATAAILAAREPLHAFIARITWAELRSAILLLGMTFIALPLVPDRTIGPFGGVNLRELWLVVIVLAAVAFGGYAAVKILGTRRGLLVAAAAGGLVSSTALTLTNARRAAAGEGDPRLLAGAALVAGTVSLVRTSVLFVLLSGTMAATAPLLAAAGVALVCGLVFSGRGAASGDGEPVLSNPFALGSVLGYALLLAAVAAASRAATVQLGSGATLTVAGIAGLADLDAATFAMASLAREAGTAALPALGVVIAAGSNTLAKAAMGLVLGGWRFAGPLLLGSALMVVTGGLVAVVT